ncbi:TraB/GumN family protein [Kangiella marina]|uniref:TraB/GumN family protein n=1 Tax=Kangiella marina TaxID=1079178 RepID=A0ABP8IK79_9GAMM
MKKLLGILFATLLGLQGCGDDSGKSQKKSPSDDNTKASTTVAETNNPQNKSQHTAQGYTPALWKIEHNGKTSYLFGSVHMGEKSMYPLPKVVTDAFNSSDTLTVEIDVTNINQMALAQKVQQMAIDPENSLESVLQAETLEKYNEYCQETKSPCSMFTSFEPWFAAMTLEALNMQQSGYSEQYGVDMYFIDRARDNKDILELETIDLQLNALDSMSPKLQDAFLYSVVTKDDSENDKLIQAWKTGDIEEYVKSSFEEAKESGINEEDYSYFMDVLLYNRNKNMADGLAKQIEDGRAVFAVVGAAHYGGEKSINDYLEQKGFTVERIEY